MSDDELLKAITEEATRMMEEVYANTTPEQRHEVLMRMKETSLAMGKEADEQYKGNPLKIVLANVGELFASVATLAYVVDALQDQVNRLEERLGA